MKKHHVLMSELPDEYVGCRLNHLWKEVEYDGLGPLTWRPTRSVVTLLFKCPRCKMKRYEAWSAVTGDCVNRVYRQPPDYSLEKGEGRKVLVRKEYLRRRAIQQITGRSSSVA